jgi:hypothetical protein
MQLTERQQDLAKILIELTVEYGPFQQSDDADGCDYKSAEQNKNHNGKCCAECVFYRKAGCAIVYGEIEDMGVCRFHIISDDSLENSEYEDEEDDAEEDGQENDERKSVSDQEEDPYEEEMMSLLNNAPFVKSIPISNIHQDKEYVYTGLGVAFGGKDLVGDTFTTGTKLGSERPFVGMKLFYDHALEDVKDEIGTVLNAKTDEAGLWFQFQLDKRHKYAEKIKQLIDEGKLGLSTGAVSHVVRRERGELKQWLIGELSLTPNPADPRTHIQTNAEQVEKEALQDAFPQQQFIIIRKKRTN